TERVGPAQVFAGKGATLSVLERLRHHGDDLAVAVVGALNLFQQAVQVAGWPLREEDQVRAVAVAVLAERGSRSNPPGVTAHDLDELDRVEGGGGFGIPHGIARGVCEEPGDGAVAGAVVRAG